MLKKSPSCRGFTLIEMMVCLIVLAIVIAIGMPSYSTWVQNTRLRNAAESIQNGLQLARAEAVARNRTVRFAIGEGSSWTVCEPEGDGCTEIQRRATGDGSSAAVTVVAVPDIANVDFDAMGRGTAISIDIDLDPAVVLANDSRNLRVVVAGGSVRMCDPNIAAPDARAC